VDEVDEWLVQLVAAFLGTLQLFFHLFSHEKMDPAGDFAVGPVGLGCQS